jgi:hypothetical protein
MKKTLHVEVYYDDEKNNEPHIIDSALLYVTETVAVGCHNSNVCRSDYEVRLWTTDAE